jgi:glycosyltransferase involved in cell wall biosynthesis
MRKAITHFTDSPTFGGAEKMLLALVEGLQAEGWEQNIVYHPGPGLAPLLEEARRLGVQTIAVKPLQEGLVGAARIPSFARLLRRLDAPVFHAHLTWSMACKFALGAAAAARVPAVVATHQLFVDFPATLSRKAQQRLIARGVDRHVAVSEHVGRRLVATFPWIAERVVVVPNAVDTDRFHVDADPALGNDLRNGTDSRLVLVPARLDKQKGQHFAIAALRDLPDVRLVLAGEGPDRGALASHARELGVADRVVFLGLRHDVPTLLATCDVAVLPSLYEGLPVAPLEAMAAGCPVVATRIGGTDEAIDDGRTGLLVPPEDSNALARGINRVLSDAELAGRLARAGRADVEKRYSVRQLVARNVRLYAELGVAA